MFVSNNSMRLQFYFVWWIRWIQYITLLHLLTLNFYQMKYVSARCYQDNNWKIIFGGVQVFLTYYIYYIHIYE